MLERELRLAGSPQSAARARQYVMDLCRRWGLRDLCEVAGLLTSETVTNAVLHAGGDVILSVARNGKGLHVEVVDPSPVWPRLRRTDQGDESGRGLRLVDALSDSWGTEPRGAGKAVWFEVGPSRRGRPFPGS